jgi:hypothetical protein
MRRSREPLNDHEPSSDEDEIPLHRKRPFGSGLKRQRVEFVRAQDADVSSLPGTGPSGPEVADVYASIVMSKPKATITDPKEPQETVTKVSKICAVCALTYTTSLEKHEATLAHQVSLSHSHPPSALDRSRMGLRTLATAGWDPDARVGLGREGDGMRFPIKVTAKEDTLGIGATPAEPLPPKPEKPRALKARERKALEMKEKQKGEGLQREIFGSVDVERYLRGDTEGNTGLR